MNNFSELLNKPMDEIETPKALPIGTYLCIVDGQPEVKQLGKAGNNAAIFSLKPIQAGADVDQTDLVNVLKGSSLQDKKLRHTLWLTEDAAWRAKQFLVEHLGVTAKTMAEALAQSMGKQVNVNLGHRASDDGTQVYSDIKSTFKA